MTITERLLHIESKYDLNTYEVDGFHPWTYTRFLIWRDISYTQAMPKEYDWKSPSAFIRNTFDVLRMPFRRCIPNVRNPLDICFVCSGRRLLSNGVYESRTTDDIAEVFHNSITLEHPYGYKHFFPAKTENLYYSDRILLGGTISGMICRFFKKKLKRKLYKRFTLAFESPLRELYSNDENKICKAIDRMILFYFMYKPLYKMYDKFLSAVQPKLLVEDVHYRIDTMVLNEVAKIKNIPVIELAHGMISDKLPMYNYSLSSEIKPFPDYLFVFSDFVIDTLSAPIPRDQVIPVGYPYFERQINLFKNSSIKTPNEKIIIFLSQPSITIGFDKLATKVQNIIASKGWKVVFKLHPREFDRWREDYPLLVESDVEVIDNPQTHLYELFVKCTALVGVNSTSIYEGIGFGLNAFIYNLPGSEDLNAVCNEGLAIKISCYEDLCEALLAEQRNDFCATDALWKPNALYNMSNEIKRILNK